MGLKASQSIVIVTRPTRMEGLKARWGTAGQAKFRLKRAHAIEEERVAQAGQGNVRMRKAEADVAGFEEYANEDQVYQRTIAQLQRDLDVGLPIKVLDRSYVPNYDFWTSQAVVVVGPDGLVANTAKYVGDVPIIAVNPDPQRVDGILLPFKPSQARLALQRVLDNKAKYRSITLAEVTLNDGQTLRAFNDFFIGCRSHVSARYVLDIEGRREPQSSSGVLVSTGAGSTGWMSSVFNMASGIARSQGRETLEPQHLSWDDRRLMWAVREPFASKTSKIDLVSGLLPPGQEIAVESLMPDVGVIFSDGIEADFLPFNSGTIARIAASRDTVRLVV